MDWLFPFGVAGRAAMGQVKVTTLGVSSCACIVTRVCNGPAALFALPSSSKRLHRK